MKTFRVTIYLSFALLMLQSAVYAHREAQFVTAFGGKGEAEGKFAKETYLAFDREGNIYVSDTENYRIQKFDGNGKFLLQIDGQKEDAGFAFQNPTDLAIGSDGSIYVLDWVMVYIARTESPKLFNYGPCVHKFAPDGKFTATFTIDDLTKQVKNIESAAPGLDAEGNYALIIPRGNIKRLFLITVDVQGHIYVLDKDEANIHKLNAEGQLVATFGSHGNGAGQFREAADIAADDAGNLYVVDTDNHRIVKFDSDCKFVKTFGEYGDEDGQLRFPFTIAISERGDILVGDKARYGKNYLSSLALRKDDPSPRYVLPGAEHDSTMYRNFRVIMQRVQQFSSDGKYEGKILVRLAQDKLQHVNLKLKAIDYQGNIYFGDTDALLLRKYAQKSPVNLSALHTDLTLLYQQATVEVDIDNPDDLDKDIGLNRSDFDEDAKIYLFLTDLRFRYDVNEDWRLSISNLSLYQAYRLEDHYRRSDDIIFGTISQDDRTLEDYIATVVQFDATLILNHEAYRYREASFFCYFGVGNYDYVNYALAKLTNKRRLDWKLWFSQWGAGIRYDLGRKFRLGFTAVQGPPGGYFNYEYDYIDEVGDLYSTGFREGAETMVWLEVDGVF